MCFDFSLQSLSETVLILRRNERDMIKNLYWSSGKVPVIIVRFYCILDSASENTEVPNFIIIRPVIAELFHADGLTNGKTGGRTKGEFMV